MLCNAALAGTEDGIRLYEANKFPEAVRAFQEVQTETMRDSRSAYYYALSLNSAGHTPQAVVVCKQIMTKFPKTEAAKQAKIAIDKWANFNAVASASAAARANYSASGHKLSDLAKQVDSNFGILGLKFEMVAGNAPRIRLIFPDTPAAKYLKTGDIIIAINGQSTENLTKEEIYDFLVGDANTTVKVTVQRDRERITNALTRLSALEFSKLHPDIWQDYLRAM